MDNADGEITIDIDKSENGQVTLKVIDNGPGVDEETQMRMFDPFFSTKKDGTGLGLAIVQRLCGGLNIDLSVKTGIGMGTTFILHFNQFSEDGSGLKSAETSKNHSLQTSQ